MNKIHSKKIFIKNKIKTPKYFSIKKICFKKNTVEKALKKKKINFPIVTKPINEGSSLGVEISKNKKNYLNQYRTYLKNIKN